MPNLILMMLSSLLAGLRTQAATQAEILALRHQLIVLQRTQKKKRLILHAADRWLWVWLSRVWLDWRSALVIVKPATVSPGIDKASAGIGAGRFVTVEQDVPVSQKKLAI
jgi:hypothetical protein